MKNKLVIKSMIKIVVAALLLIMGIFSYFNTFEDFENMSKDAIYQKRGQIDKRIVIIGIDENSLDKIGKWPWPRSIHGKLIEEIEKGEPAVIGIDIVLSEADLQKDEDLALEEVLKKHDNIVLPIVGVFGESIEAGKVEAQKLLRPIYDIGEKALLGHINVFPDGDGVVRHALMKIEGENEEIKNFSWEISRKFLASSGKEKQEWNLPLDEFNRMYIDFSGKPFDTEMLSYEKVLNGEVPAQYFKNKIVLIGPYSVGIGDTYTTSIEKQIPMFGIEIHANIIRNLLGGGLKTELPSLANLIVVLFIGLVGYALISRLSFGKSILAVSLIGLMFILALKYIYSLGYVMNVIYPLLALILIYLAIAAFNYIDELREKKYVRDLFGRYVSNQVVEEILEKGRDGIRIGGISKEASFLFVDIRGFTTLTETLDSVTIVEIVNECLNVFANAIFEYEGMLDKFIGDAAMGIFNAPLDIDKHPLKAVLAGWKMQKDGEKLNKIMKEKYGVDIGFGVGINTGKATIGNIGAEFRMDYTAIGDAVNIAARVESMAKAGQVLISQSVYERVKDYVDVTDIGELKVKGKEILIKTYAIRGIKNES